MKIHLIPSVEFVREEDIKDRVIIVIDVLRATSVITTAMGNGALEILPTVEIEEALSLRRGNELLGGERKGLKIEGFDFSNSPLEYTKDRVSGKTIIMTTTNGTKAITKSMGAHKIYIGSMLNGRAVAKKALGHNRDISILCSGTYGKFSLDDFACAGKIIYDILDMSEFQLEDMAAAAYAAYRDHKTNIISYVSMASHYNYLLSIDLKEDVNYCFKEDIFDLVPEYKEGKIKSDR